MLNTTAYSQTEFEARQQQRAEQMQAALNNDATFQAAARALEKAKADLEHLEVFVKNQSSLQRRLQYNQNVVEAKKAVQDAEKAALTARNQVYRQAHLQRLEEQRQARNQAQTEQQNKLASEQEAEARRQFQAAWLQSGGTVETFQQKWPEMWQAELQRRSTEQVVTSKAIMGQRYQL